MDINDTLQILKKPWVIGIILILFLFNFKAIERFFFYGDYEFEVRKSLIAKEALILEKCLNLKNKYTPTYNSIEVSLGHTAPKGFFTRNRHVQMYVKFRNLDDELNISSTCTMGVHMDVDNVYYGFKHYQYDKNGLGFNEYPCDDRRIFTDNICFNHVPFLGIYDLEK